MINKSTKGRETTMFSSFNFEDFTKQISSAAQTAQDTINNTILTPDAQTKLQFKKTTRYLQEKVGTISQKEISKLPDSYQTLEEKTDVLEKVLKRILQVSKTFEIEGYDYPPNISEGINHWWNEKKDDSSILSESFAIALSRSANDSHSLLNGLKEDERKRKEAATVTEDGNGEDAEEDEEDEEDEELNNLVSSFESMSNCFSNIHKSKTEMDAMIKNEFNKKLEHLLDVEFKQVHTLRKKVEDSRLEFDTVRHEIKMKEKKSSSSAESNKKPVTGEPSTEKSTEEEEETSTKNTEKTTERENEAPNEEEEEATSEETKLLEKLEDDFVSNITVAVEKMTEITDSTEIVNLIKLFENFQLVHYRQCVQELEKSLKKLNEFESAE